MTEIDTSLATRTARFRLKASFVEEPIGVGRILDGVVCDEPTFRVSTEVLEHRTPCLGFAIEEVAHLNVWKNRLAERGLPVGPWLRELKRAVLEERPDDYTVRIGAPTAAADIELPLGRLRDAVTIAPGQKIAYVADAADTEANRKAIIRLVRAADLLFIEAAFAAADAPLATERAHLTTSAAGELARAAGVRRVEPFHFSKRYSGEEERMFAEVMDAFCGRTGSGVL